MVRGGRRPGRRGGHGPSGGVVVKDQLSRRLIRLVQAILRGEEKSWSPLNAQEATLVSRAANIRDMDAVIDGGVVDLLRENTSSWLQTQEVAMFVSGLEPDPDGMDMVLRVIRAARGKNLDFRNGLLTRVYDYAEENGMPPELAVNAFIEDKRVAGPSGWRDPGFTLNRRLR